LAVEEEARNPFDTVGVPDSLVSDFDRPGLIPEE
jgi:hypothetical protein